VAQRTTKVSGSTKSTTDHDEIRRWVEQKGAHPAIVKGTNILRVDFPGFSGEGSLEEISWEDFFDKFEESKLALIYQDQTKSGRASRFNKLVRRDSIGNSGSMARGRARSTSARRKTRSKKKTTSSNNGKGPAGLTAAGARTQTKRASRSSSQGASARTVHRTASKKRKRASSRARAR